MGVVFFVALLASIVSFFVRSYRRRNYIRLRDQEVSMPFCNVPTVYLTIVVPPG